MRRELDKHEWGPFLDRLSKLFSSSDPRLQRVSLFVVRRAVSSAPIIGVTYDRKDDEVDVAFETIDHLVHKPVGIVVDESLDGLKMLEVIDAEGTRHVLEPAVSLPLPDAAF